MGGKCILADMMIFLRRFALENPLRGDMNTTKTMGKTCCTFNLAEYPKIWEVLNRHLSAKFGISVPWPSED